MLLKVKLESDEVIAYKNRTFYSKRDFEDFLSRDLSFSVGKLKVSDISDEYDNFEDFLELVGNILVYVEENYDTSFNEKIFKELSRWFYNDDLVDDWGDEVLYNTIGKIDNLVPSRDFIELYIELKNF